VQDSTADGQCLFLPKQLGNQLDLQQLFPAHAWDLVSPAYANCCQGVATQQWLALMQALGVQTFLPVRQRTIELTWKQLMLEQQHMAWKDAVDKLDDSVRYVFTDWHWDDLQLLLQSIAGDADAVRRTEQYRQLSRVIAEQWQALQTSRQLHCSYSVRTVAVAAPSAAAAPTGGFTVGKSDERSPAQRRKKKAAAASEGADSSKSKSLSAAASAWQPGKRKLPSSVLQSLRNWPWVLASDGKPHAPTELFASQQVLCQDCFFVLFVKNSHSTCLAFCMRPYWCGAVTGGHADAQRRLGMFLPHSQLDCMLLCCHLLFCGVGLVPCRRTSRRCSSSTCCTSWLPTSPVTWP
jgi:hypothetical protein